MTMTTKRGRGQTITLFLAIGRARRNHRQMPRKPRVEFTGAIYHVMSRDDRRENIFWTIGSAGIPQNLGRSVPKSRLPSDITATIALDEHRFVASAKDVAEQLVPVIQAQG